MALEFQERMKMGVVCSVVKRGCVCVTYTLNTRMCKYRRVTRGQDGVKVKSMRDLVLVKKDMLCFVQDVRAMRGMG